MDSARYHILIPKETLPRLQEYRRSLQAGQGRAGGHLRRRLQRLALESLTDLDLLGELLDTKAPQIFAESAVSGDGSDWNLTELGLLGDISVAVPVTIFDNGHHSNPTPHTEPFLGTLVFTPGALLDNGRGQPPADWNEATKGDQICLEGLYQLYQRRWLPVFQYIDRHAPGPRSALLTVPGIGCGQFAGPFRGQLGPHLQAILLRFLQEHGASFPRLKAVYFDPYSECQNERYEVGGISLLVRPLTATGNRSKSQLCRPVEYAELGDDFSSCSFFSLVAWDHVSWPGNDFFVGARVTDDGVKAAATSSMAALTGLDGAYDPASAKYQPPQPFLHWEEVVRQHRLCLWNPAVVWSLDSD
jgi:hypothetical protein